ncbi:MAG: restriction endonuclease subunit S, partial [Elusimicrobiota bacterium]|nr:restriction endonuclease subunit S [Elusimicrobiota bacterium]
KTRQDKTRQDKTRQDKTRQDKTRQDKTRQDKTRQDKTRHRYLLTDVGIIPEDWIVKNIGDLFEFSAGGDVDKKAFSDVQTADFSYPIYANALTNQGIYGYSSKYTIGQEAITITGRGEVGKTFYREKHFTPIVRLIAAIPKEGIDAKFMSYAFSCINFINESTGVPQLTVPQIVKYMIAYPENKAEQTAIAQVLSDMDTEILVLQKQREKYKQIKAGMMTQLLTGKTRLAA